MVIRIKEVRSAKGHTQSSLARVSGVRRELICRYENGKATPDISVLLRLRKALNCSLDDLVSDAE